jgi:HPt (histidine-containing phosphotransfer) domain-containing protein
MGSDMPSNNDSPLNPMDLLLAKLSEQQSTISRQQQALRASDDDTSQQAADVVHSFSTASSVHSAPAETNLKMPVEPSVRSQDADELTRLKQELERAKGEIARKDQELIQTRITKHTIEQVIGTTSEADYSMNHGEGVSLLQQPFEPVTRPTSSRDNSWSFHEDSKSDTSDAMSASGFNRSRAIWNGNGRQQYPLSAPVTQTNFNQTNFNQGAWAGRGAGQQFTESSMSYGSAMTGYRADRLTPDLDVTGSSAGGRNYRNNGRLPNRSNVGFPFPASNSSYDMYAPAAMGYGSVGGMAGSAAGNALSLSLAGTALEYQPQPIGTPLSPFAPEFTSASGSWKNDVSRPRDPFHI